MIGAMLDHREEAIFLMAAFVAQFMPQARA